MQLHLILHDKAYRWPKGSMALNACNGHAQVAPTLEDLDWLQDNGPCLRLESLQLPGATGEPRGEAYLRSVLQCSAASLTRLDLGHMAASSLEFLEGLSQQNTLHALDISGQTDCQLPLCMPAMTAFCPDQQAWHNTLAL